MIPLSLAPPSLRVARGLAAAVGEVPLSDQPGSCWQISLRSLAGASALHLALTNGAGKTLWRGEVTPVEEEETVVVDVEIQEDETFHVTSPRRVVLTLPPNERYAPAPPLLPVAADASLDLMLVLDGTMRHRAGDRLLLQEKEVWQELVERLVSLVENLASGRRECRVALLAFGDRMPSGIVAADLKPTYLLYPEEDPVFQPLDGARLRRDLLSIPASAGGDFVDALADALRACSRLRWRGSSRKVVFLCGDSPGHSVLHPLRKEACWIVRSLDIDYEAARLHRQGIEIATLYHDPPADLGLEDLAFKRDLLLKTRQQYLRLASLPSLAFAVSSFAPDPTAAALRERNFPLARGAAFGRTVEAEE